MNEREERLSTQENVFLGLPWVSSCTSEVMTKQPPAFQFLNMYYLAW